MIFLSNPSNCFGKCPLKGRNQNRKKMISPVLSRENLVSRNPAHVLNYQQQSILMPPVKKPLIKDFSKKKINFLKV